MLDSIPDDMQTVLLQSQAALTRSQKALKKVIDNIIDDSAAVDDVMAAKELRTENVRKTSELEFVLEFAKLPDGEAVTGPALKMLKDSSQSILTRMNMRCGQLRTLPKVERSSASSTTNA